MKLLCTIPLLFAVCGLLSQSLDLDSTVIELQNGELFISGGIHTCTEGWSVEELLAIRTKGLSKESITNGLIIRVDDNNDSVAHKCCDSLAKNRDSFYVGIPEKSKIDNAIKLWDTTEHSVVVYIYYDDQGIDRRKLDGKLKRQSGRVVRQTKRNLRENKDYDATKILNCDSPPFDKRWLGGPKRFFEGPKMGNPGTSGDGGIVDIEM